MYSRSAIVEREPPKDEAKAGEADNSDEQDFTPACCQLLHCA